MATESSSEKLGLQNQPAGDISDPEESRTFLSFLTLDEFALPDFKAQILNSLVLPVILFPLLALRMQEVTKRAVRAFVVFLPMIADFLLVKGHERRFQRLGESFGGTVLLQLRVQTFHFSVGADAGFGGDGLGKTATGARVGRRRGRQQRL